MGVVYLAEDTTLSRQVAIKVLYSTLTADAVFVNRFKQEARVVAQILHPNIVRINSLETIDLNLAIDMEFIDGPSLAAVMSDQIITPVFAVQIARDVLQGLAVCHELGVVHRDIKPNNILLGPNGRAKIADFGLATAYATHLESTVYRLSTSSFFMGTPRFAPPEAWEGAAPRPQSDLYSLGLVLYEGLVGRPIYTGGSPLAIIKQIMCSPLPKASESFPDISKPFANLLDDLVSQQIDQRPEHAGVALERLQQVPEYKHTTGDDAVTVRVAVRKHKTQTRNRAMVRKVARTFIPILLIGALALVSTTVLRYFGIQSGNTTETTTPVQRRSQQDLGTGMVRSADELLQLSRTPQSANAEAFTARYIGAGAVDTDANGKLLAFDRDEQWLMTPLEVGRYRVTGFSDRLLTVFEVIEGEDGLLEASGNWSGYRHDTGVGLMEGTLHGKGTWTDKGKSLNLLLEFMNTRDRSTNVLSVTAVLSTPKTDTRFVFDLENTSLLQALIYNELLPRERGWVRNIELMLPCTYGARLQVPMLAAANLTIDGALDETEWKHPYFSPRGRIGILEGKVIQGRATLHAIATTDALALGFRLAGVARNEFGVRVLLMPLRTTTLDLHPRLDVTQFRNEDPEYRCFTGDRELPWTEFGWTVSLAADERSITAEVLIPANSLTDAIKPASRTFWRANFALVGRTTGGEEEVLALWGFPELLAVEHGVVVSFGERRP